MAEKFRFMDPVQLPDGTYDREYNAQEFTDYFKALVTTGVMKSVGSQLAVSANGANMVTRIDTGLAFILGRYYENDSFKEHTHDTETLGNSRIDRIVVRMDLSPDKRSVLSFIKKGAPSPNPVPPVLTQNNSVYEISLAQVRVVGGQTFIAVDAVTDERGTNVICPWAGSNILPSFDDNALSQHINDTEKHLQDGERDKINNALQPNAFNDVNKYFNIGNGKIEFETFISSTSWTMDVYEVAHINIPCVDYWGSLELTLSSQYAYSDAAGSLRAILHIGKVGSESFTNKIEIISVSDRFAEQYFISEMRYGPNHIDLLLLKNKSAKNNVVINMQAYNTGGRVMIENTWVDIVQNTFFPAVLNKGLDQRINELFTSVSNGKAAVANAITQKGVPTAADAEFATMTANIQAIATTVTGTGNAYQSGPNVVFNIVSLPFRPRTLTINSPALGNRSIMVYWDQIATNPANAFFYSLGTNSWVNYNNGALNVTDNSFTYSIPNLELLGPFNYIAAK